MPFYEYRATDEKESCSYCICIFEVRQSIKDKPLKKCPECGSKIERLISNTAAFITPGRQANQYSDVKAAKYWRDNNGVRHKVTAADGSRGSPTVSRKVTASPAMIKARKEADKKRTKNRLKRTPHPLRPYLRKK